MKYNTIVKVIPLFLQQKGKKMKINYEILKKSPLFNGISTTELQSMLACLSATHKSYKKDEFIFYSGDTINQVGMVLSGGVHILKEDFWGNRTIIAKIEPGDMFGETYACVKSIPIEVSVLCSENTDILFMDINKIMETCDSKCGFHYKLIQNLLFVFAQKNLMLTKKMSHTTQRSTREKLLSYLSAESIAHNSHSFKIPFNRQQLADYLSVDRSAMSNELSKLQKEGILTYEKNHFTLID